MSQIPEKKSHYHNVLGPQLHDLEDNIFVCLEDKILICKSQGVKDHINHTKINSKAQNADLKWNNIQAFFPGHNYEPIPKAETHKIDESTVKLLETFKGEQLNYQAIDDESDHESFNEDDSYETYNEESDYGVDEVDYEDAEESDEEGCTNKIMSGDFKAIFAGIMQSQYGIDCSTIQELISPKAKEKKVTVQSSKKGSTTSGNAKKTTKPLPEVKAQPQKLSNVPKQGVAKVDNKGKKEDAKKSEAIAKENKGIAVKKADQKEVPVDSKQNNAAKKDNVDTKPLKVVEDAKKIVAKQEKNEEAIASLTKKQMKSLKKIERTEEEKKVPEKKLKEAEEKRKKEVKERKLREAEERKVREAEEKKAKEVEKKKRKEAEEKRAKEAEKKKLKEAEEKKAKAAKERAENEKMLKKEKAEKAVVNKKAEKQSNKNKQKNKEEEKVQCENERSDEEEESFHEEDIFENAAFVKSALRKTRNDKKEEAKKVVPKKKGKNCGGTEMVNPQMMAAMNFTNPQECVSKAIEMSQTKQTKLALFFFTQAIQLEPSNLGHYLNRAACHLQLKAAKEALNDALHVVKNGSSNNQIGIAKFSMGLAYKLLQNYESAEECFEEALQLEFDSNVAFRELMHVKVKQLVIMGFSEKRVIDVLLNHPNVKDACEILANQEVPDSNDAEISDDYSDSEIYESDTEQDPSMVRSLSNLTDYHAHKYFEGKAIEAKKLKKTSSAPPQYQPAQNQQSHPATKKIILVERPVQPQKLPKVQTINNQIVDERVIWVGNLTPEISESAVKKAFSKFGRVLSFIPMPNASYGFVNYESPVPIAYIIEVMNQYEINGIKINVRSKPKKFM